ncbi:MAG TPA: hypothetical protein VK776_20410 [Bryobacteraceae bacterium]|jgi:hypothetical protein|nr:hypothetical protein [Bryobacteraceae bacterium]
MFWREVAILSLVPTALVFGGSITFEGPFGPTDGSVTGPNLYFDIQDATLAQPANAGGDWMLTVHTNYPIPLPGPPGNVIPSFRSYAASDFLVAWDGGFFGIVLHGHDGYMAGDLYQAAGFQTAGQARGIPTDPNEPAPYVWLSAGGSLLGNGTVSAAAYGDGVTQASYTITDVFQAPSGFLQNGAFTIYMSSADSGFGYMTGTGVFSTAGNVSDPPDPPSVPEPGALYLFTSGLLLISCLSLLITKKSIR